MSTYDESSIKVLEDIQHIRLRPAMYINTDSPSLQMFEEIFSNSMDEALNGYANTIRVNINYEKSQVEISDDGRGLPQGINKTLQKPTPLVIYTKLNSGGKYDTESYNVSGGLHGVGSCVVNALSKELVLTTYRNRSEVVAVFDKGISVSYDTKYHDNDDTGTIVKFIIDTDHEIFDSDKLSDHEHEIEMRLHLVSTLYPSLNLYYQGSRVTGGDLSSFLPDTKYVLSNPVEYNSKGIRMSLNWTDSLRGGTYESYCNMIHTIAGGDHVKAIEDAILKVFDEKTSLLGMNLIVHVTHSSVSYTGQSKDRAKSQDMYLQVNREVYSYLRTYFKSHESEFDTLKKLFASKQDLLDRKAHKRVTKQDRRTSFLSSLDTGGFADCTTRDRSKAELTLCEGLSAAGSLKQARDPSTQAVMPLRGKFINAYNADLKTVLSNREASTIIQSIGTGILDEFDISKSRYSKIIIFSDSDEDGKDIACQLIAFFSKIMPEILTSGMLYLAIPPLYGTTVKGEFIPIHTEESKEYHLKQGHYVQRYKGLGEMMPSQLRVTSLDPDTRRLIQLKVDETSLSTIERIMGGGSINRKSLLIEMGVFK